jgi:hypothetical protein
VKILWLCVKNAESPWENEGLAAVEIQAGAFPPMPRELPATGLPRRVVALVSPRRPWVTIARTRSTVAEGTSPGKRRGPCGRMAVPLKVGILGSALAMRVQSDQGAVHKSSKKVARPRREQFRLGLCAMLRDGPLYQERDSSRCCPKGMEAPKLSRPPGERQPYAGPFAPPWWPRACPAAPSDSTSAIRRVRQA